MSTYDAKRIRRIDTIYTLSALLVLTVGFLRVFLFENGKDYYYLNFFFWAKLGLFTVVGLLRIYPSIIFSRWKNVISSGQGVELAGREYTIIRQSINFEIIGLVLMMLAASLMAKGLNLLFHS